ncbi:hypothetical protein A2U01_0066258, partial [Trifolium medium]|nr:hypothetical protein [Trifolium medium]
MSGRPSSDLMGWSVRTTIVLARKYCRSLLDA